MSAFVKLTVAQAIVKYLENQRTEMDGSRLGLCGGGFGMIGHGTVTYKFFFYFVIYKVIFINI